MERLEEFEARDKDIQDLTGMQFAKNLGFLALDRNQISDLSPIARLINLRVLLIQENLLSDISPVRGLTNLTYIEIDDMPVSDLSPLAGLINLDKNSRGRQLYIRFIPHCWFTKTGDSIYSWFRNIGPNTFGEFYRLNNTESRK